jgi:hypothetical protein
MLWKYASATDMVGVGPVGGFHGASGCHLQMGGRRRGGSLFRSSLARRGKDRHSRIVGSRRVWWSAQCNRAGRAVSGDCSGRAQLHRIFDQLAGAAANLFRRRCRGSAFESQPCAAPQSIHYLAFERQTVGFPADLRFVCTAAPGSRHLRTCGDHYRSANKRVTDQQQRDLLCASAFGAVAAVPAAQVALSLARPEARLVS